MVINNHIKSVSDYLAIINEFNASYPLVGMANSPIGCKFLYRGHSNKSYNLMPSIFRQSRDIDITIDDYVMNKRYLSYASERDILKAFISEACAYIKEDPSKSFYKWAEYAQHYGAPTRFLDWTENPLVALYFACKDNKPTYQNHGGDIGGKDGCVWMLHLGNYRHYVNQTNNTIYGDDLKKDYTIIEAIEKIYQNKKPEILFRYPIIYKPFYVDARMSAQSSMFMVWGKEETSLDSLLSDEKRTLRSNEVASGTRCFSTSQNEELSFRFEIFSGAKQSILRELDHCGINEKTLFPGIDGIGRYVEMKYRFDLEEAKDHI